jgi:SAM-dependent methyltransferase
MTAGAAVAGRCPVCGGESFYLASVDFNKSCEEIRGKFLDPSGIPVDYHACSQCGFAYTPELYGWKIDEFAERIYNDEYVEVDPDYRSSRPRSNAQALQTLVGTRGSELRHLDFGGGNGVLSETLRGAGWQSTSYDPFVDGDLRKLDYGRFDLVSAFEVFEHVPDPQKLMNEIELLCDEDAVVLFSTLLSDGNLAPGGDLTWWYASPRNGHISLFSRKSLEILAAQRGFRLGSFSQVFHALWKRIPPWASHFLRD